ncbi:hypothetical protein ACFQNF_11210 [Iodobacter arcticus]|uniref:Uncharacterized protein n=1 Tax=Iodobacter arcticus TaxID=590593 RepID=A0ABW2QXM7_9NEIS
MKGRFYEFKSSLDFCKLLELIKIYEFDEAAEESMGFLINEFSGNLIAATFYEKWSVSEEITLPSNAKIEQKISLLRKIDFEIDRQFFPSMFIYNPPRSLVSLFSAIASALNFECTIEPLTVDVKATINRLKETVDKLELNSVECSGLRYNNNIVAKVILKSNNDITDFFSKSEYSKGIIDIASMRLFYLGGWVDLDLSKGGSIKIGKNKDELRRFVVSSLKYSAT